MYLIYIYILDISIILQEEKTIQCLVIDYILKIMISDEIISVVADIGNLYTRVGFTGDDFPRWNTYTKCTDNF